MASYLYDTWGNLTTSSETIPNANGWVNPYRFDGRDGVRYDSADGLNWMRVRAYDPSLGRFLSRDPLGRAPLFGVNDNPYVYAGNNPLSNVDPSGERAMGASASQARNAAKRYAQTTRVHTHSGGAADAYRRKAVSKLHELAYWLGVASLAAFFAGDALLIYFDIKADKLLNVLVDLSDLAGQAVELIHVLGEKLGQGLTSLADRLRPVVEAVGTATSTLRGLLQLPFVGAAIQGVLNGIVNYIMPGLEGPFGIALSLASASLGGAFADLIRAGGHALAWIQTQVEYQASADLAMPIAQFCSQDGGCPRQ